MKIPLTRELKIVLLKALKAGELDTDDLTGVKDLYDGNLFYQLLMETGVIDEEKVNDN